MAEADWRAVAEKAESAIRDAENSMTVDGQPIAPAYVVITNHTFLADEDVTGHPCFGFLQTIKIDDYPFGRPMEIEAALEGYDRAVGLPHQKRPTSLFVAMLHQSANYSSAYSGYRFPACIVDSAASSYEKGEQRGVLARRTARQQLTSFAMFAPRR
ncbi:hypothetical protein [Bradyrhizobium sp.]|uniref:hypothetical protein n=1 Tax=Bradyrhizobium sp. TaxID=376 RepID=UPI003C70A8DB